MTTLTLRMVKGNFVVTGPDIEPMLSSRRARGEGLVHGAPSGLAYQGSIWPAEGETAGKNKSAGRARGSEEDLSR